MNTTYVRCAGVEAAPLDSDCILFHPDANRFFVLNGTAAFIWTKLESGATVEEIAGELQRNFREVTEERAVADVQQALLQMLDLSVVETSAQA